MLYIITQKCSLDIFGISMWIIKVNIQTSTLNYCTLYKSEARIVKHWSCNLEQMKAINLEREREREREGGQGDGGWESPFWNKPSPYHTGCGVLYRLSLISHNSGHPITIQPTSNMQCDLTVVVNITDRKTQWCTVGDILRVHRGDQGAQKITWYCHWLFTRIWTYWYVPKH